MAKVRTDETRTALAELQQAVAAVTATVLGDEELYMVFDAVITGGRDDFAAALFVLDEGALISGYERLRSGWGRLVEGVEILLTELVRQQGTGATVHFPRMKVAALPQVDAVGRSLQALGGVMDTLILAIVTPGEGWTPGELFWIETVIARDDRPRFRPFSYSPVIVSTFSLDDLAGGEGGAESD